MIWDLLADERADLIQDVRGPPSHCRSELIVVARRWIQHRVDEVRNGRPHPVEAERVLLPVRHLRGVVGDAQSVQLLADLLANT